MTDTFTDWMKTEPVELPSGVESSAITGEQLQVVRQCLPGHPSGRSFAPHKHPHEQFVLVLEGSIEFTVGESGEKVSTLGPGGVFYFAPNEPHAARVVSSEDVIFVEIYTPPRRDYTGEIENPDHLNPM